MGQVVPFERAAPTGEDDIPSPAMARWLRLANHNRLLPEEYAPYHTVMIRTKRACEWRGWVKRTEIDADAGCIQGVEYYNPIEVYHITDAGLAALSRAVDADQ